MGIFNEFFKKEKPVFTGIARGLGGFGFGGSMVLELVVRVFQQLVVMCSDYKMVVQNIEHIFLQHLEHLQHLQVLLIDYLVVGGGGGGGGISGGGGGGAGGLELKWGGSIGRTICHYQCAGGAGGPSPQNRGSDGGIVQSHFHHA